MEKKFLKTVMYVSGAFLAADALLLTVTSNMNLGIIITFAISLALILLASFGGKAPKWLKGVFGGGICVLIAVIIALFGYGMNDTVTGNEDAVIVLGCGIRGEKLTVGLKNRLDAAVEICNKNEDAVVVVSGGQGAQESITEALAMERYLLTCGVEAQRIIKEEKSTSTYENFLFTKQLLDERFNGEYTVAFVSNEYHIFRAQYLSERVGLKNATHSHSSTMWYSVFPCCAREALAVAKTLVIGK